MSRKTLPTHHFLPSGITDWAGVETCATCPLRRTHPVHEIEEPPPEVGEAEARRYGEHDDTDDDGTTT